MTFLILGYVPVVFLTTYIPDLALAILECADSVFRGGASDENEKTVNCNFVSSWNDSGTGSVWKQDKSECESEISS